MIFSEIFFTSSSEKSDSVSFLQSHLINFKAISFNRLKCDPFRFYFELKIINNYLKLNDSEFIDFKRSVNLSFFTIYRHCDQTLARNNKEN